jgi:hypothetical protein
MRSRTAVFACGALAGVVVGWLLAQYRFNRHRTELFSDKPLRRYLGALGFLAGQRGWRPSDCSGTTWPGETQPVLRRRARPSFAGWRQPSDEGAAVSGGASSWSFREEDAQRLQAILARFLRDASARTALIVDRTGQLVATVGEVPVFDPTAFASLTAADFSANDQLARMLGEPEFGALFHQGERESMYLADIARRVILSKLTIGPRWGWSSCA